MRFAASQESGKRQGALSVIGCTTGRMASETRTRSLIKMVTYRLSAVALLAAVSFYYTGNAGESTVISLVFNLVGSVVYYACERLWDAINWGRRSNGSIPVGTIAVSPGIQRATTASDEEAGKNERRIR